MIFVTVGHLNPFDRLVNAVDEWASHHEDVEVFAQIGDSKLKPSHIEWSQFLEPTEFKEKMESCDAVVAHAGMGTILTAMQLGKPVLIMPRQPEEGAQNNHQIASAEAFSGRGAIMAAMNDEEFQVKMDRLREMMDGDKISSFASESLIKAIRDAIDG